jgi:hypothetical protein
LATDCRRRHRKQPSACVRTVQSLVECLAIGPGGTAGHNVQIDSTGGLIGKVDHAKLLHALPQKSHVLFRRKLFDITVDKLGRRGIDVHSPITFDVEDALDIQHIQLVVPAKSDRSRAFAKRHAVVEKFEVNAFVGALYPGEKQLRHPGVGFDAMGERIVHRLVAPELESLVPTPARRATPAA